VANIESVTKRPPHLRFHTSAIPLLRLRRCQAARKHYRYALLFTSPRHAVVEIIPHQERVIPPRPLPLKLVPGQDVHCRQGCARIYVNRCLTIGGSLGLGPRWRHARKARQGYYKLWHACGTTTLADEVGVDVTSTWPTFCPRPIWAFGGGKEATSLMEKMIAKGCLGKSRAKVLHVRRKEKVDQ
jgi:hypothetical protein